MSVEQGIREIRIALTPEGKDLKAVTVMGDRLRGQARALNQQRNAGNIGNVISADQIGRFPNQNIGEALRRVPGIAMQNDQGEARDIIIRGLAPQLNSVTLNGTRIPSAEGDNRRIQMDLIPADIIQTLEVNKTLTPDMDADAIGGSVNLRFAGNAHPQMICGMSQYPQPIFHVFQRLGKRTKGRESPAGREAERKEKVFRGRKSDRVTRPGRFLQIRITQSLPSLHFSVQRPPKGV